MITRIFWSVGAIALVCAMTVNAQTVENSAPDPTQSHLRAVACLTSAIAYEAGFESVTGQEAVAEVIINRARSTWFPHSICGVVYQGTGRTTGCQFSFACDGALRRKLPAAVMAASQQIAEAAIRGALIPHVAGATHYHADYVSPYWAPSLVRITKIGAHIFYRIPGAPDQSAGYGAFTIGSEPMIAGAAQGAVANGSVPSRLTEPVPFSPWGLAITR